MMHLQPNEQQRSHFIVQCKATRVYASGPQNLQSRSSEFEAAHLRNHSPRSLSSDTHPQLPLLLLRLQHQPLNHILQPLLLAPQLLQPQRLPAPVSIRTRTAPLPRAATAPRASHRRAPFADPTFQQLRASYESLFAAHEFVQVDLDFGKERGDLGGQGGEEGGLGGLEGGFGEEFEMLG